MPNDLFLILMFTFSIGAFSSASCLVGYYAGRLSAFRELQQMMEDERHKNTKPLHYPPPPPPRSH